MALAAEVLPRTFGRYTLLEHLGEGGMAEVLLARQEGIEGTHRLVALKRILPGLARDEDFVEMFLDEVRIVFGLHHPNIGHILDVGVVEGSHYLAMEYIQGRDLAQACRAIEKTGEAIPLDLVVEIGRQVSSALHHAHTKTTKSGRPLNIVHRDITPDNVIVTFDGTIKLVDFGIAIAENRISSTRAGLLKGKPPYMSPEQVLGLSVDGRADLFALGVVLYRLVTGVHPFAASGPERIFKRIIEDTPEAPDQVVDGCPSILSDAIMRSLAKDPDERFECASGLGDALDEVAVGIGRLPTPRSISKWLAELFPQAAAARDRALLDPDDNRAALDASYLSVSADLHRELNEDDEHSIVSDLVTGPGMNRGGADDPAKRISSPSFPWPSAVDSRLAREERDDPDANTIVHTEVFEERDSASGPFVGKKLDRALKWAFDEKGEARDELCTDPEERPAQGRGADVAVEAKPVASLQGAVWSPRQHWEHLPARFRSTPVVSAASLIIAAWFLFAILGVRSCL